jgi:hypothetical protein
VASASDRITYSAFRLAARRTGLCAGAMGVEWRRFPCRCAIGASGVALTAGIETTRPSHHHCRRGLTVLTVVGHASIPKGMRRRRKSVLQKKRRACPTRDLGKTFATLIGPLRLNLLKRERLMHTVRAPEALVILATRSAVPANSRPAQQESLNDDHGTVRWFQVGTLLTATEASNSPSIEAAPAVWTVLGRHHSPRPLPWRPDRQTERAPKARQGLGTMI